MKYLAQVATLQLDAERCTGCGLCRTVCPHGVFRLAGGKAEVTDPDLCMECGACANNCASGAIEVEKGVGCAAALINSMITGGEPTCGCDGGEQAGGCC